MMMPSGLRPYPVSFWLPRILLSIMVCGILAVGIVLFTLTVLSDNRWIKQSIISMLEGLAGGPLQIETLQVDLFPSPEIHLAGLSFETHDPGFIVLRVNRLEVGIDWQSLWDRKLFINHAVIDQPELTLQIPLGTESEEQSALPFQTIRELAIYNGQLHLFHVSGKELLSNLDWADIDLTLTELPSEGSSKIQLSAVLPNLQPPSTLALKGTLTFLEDQEEPPPPQHAHSGFQALEVHGQVEISRFPLGQLIQFVRHHELEAPLQTKGSIQGTFSYTLKHDYDLFTIQNVLFSLNEWTFAGHGSISNIFFESPRLEISGTTQPIAIRKVPVLLPDDWFPEPFLAFLDEHHVAGTMELLEGTLSGPLDGNGSWDVNGALGLKGGQFLPAPGQPLITNVAGIVTYGSSAIQISQAQGTIAPFTITTPEATLVLGEETIRLSIPTFRISEKDWNLNGTAMFTRTQNNPPMLTVSGFALPISIQRLANLIPETWRPGFVHTVLTERDIDGAMQLLTGSVKWIGDTTNTVNA
ncbi:MAG: AsmA family protein, partial [Nitrospirales bacterium]